jgi:hypothetical protein
MLESNSMNEQRTPDELSQLPDHLSDAMKVLTRGRRLNKLIDEIHEPGGAFKAASKIARLEDELANLCWQTIETAPKEGYFLVWCPDEKIGGLVEHWSAKNFHDAAMRKQWAHLGIPTHWMPLPEAPTP